MKSSTFAAALAAVIGSAFVLVHEAPPAGAATKYCDGPKVTWRTSLWGTRRAVTESVEYVSKAVKDATCGNFDIQLFYGEQLSKSRENLDSIKVGAIQAAQVCSSYHPGKVRPLTVLDLPFLPIANLDVQQEVYERLYETDAFKEALRDWNAMYYLATILPQFEFMGRGAPPKTVEDWRGKRVRALGGMGKAMEAIGAVPTTVPAPEVYTALQRGTVEAVGLSFSYAFSAFKTEEIAEWFTTNTSAGTVNCIFAFSIGAYDKLPEQYRTILAEVREPAYAVMKDAYVSQDKVNVPKWRADPKMTEVRYSEEELEKFRKLGAAPVWDEWIKDNEAAGIPAKELLDLVLQTVREAETAMAGKR